MASQSAKDWVARVAAACHSQLEDCRTLLLVWILELQYLVAMSQGWNNASSTEETFSSLLKFLFLAMTSGTSCVAEN